MDRTAHTPIRTEDLNGTDLQGANVYGPDDNNIGDIHSLHGTGMSGQAIVDVGGFLGMGAKRVALPVSELNFTRDDGGKVHATTRMTKDELKNMPEYNG